MKKIAVLATFAAFAIAPASANEIEDACVAYAEEYGTDSGGCACLGEAADADEDLAAAIMEIASPEDLQDADQDTKDAIAACFA